MSVPFNEDPVVLNENDVFIFLRTFNNEHSEAIFTLGGNYLHRGQHNI